MKNRFGSRWPVQGFVDWRSSSAERSLWCSLYIKRSSRSSGFWASPGRSRDLTCRQLPALLCSTIATAADSSRLDDSWRFVAAGALASSKFRSSPAC